LATFWPSALSVENPDNFVFGNERNNSRIASQNGIIFNWKTEQYEKRNDENIKYRAPLTQELALKYGVNFQEQVKRAIYPANRRYTLADYYRITWPRVVKYFGLSS
jgi:hypothetical protein